MNTTLDPKSHAAIAAFASYGIFFFILTIIAIVFSIVIYWRIASKAGYPGVASLLMFVPLVNVIMIIIFAFAEWPVEKRAHLASGIGGPPVTY